LETSIIALRKWGSHFHYPIYLRKEK